VITFAKPNKIHNCSSGAFFRARQRYNKGNGQIRYWHP